MKIYRSNYNKLKWYKKINWIKLLTWIVILSVSLTLLLNYLGKGNDFERAITTSLLITSLIGVDIVLSDLFRHKSIILIEDKKELKYVDLQYGKDGTYIPYYEYEEIITKDDPKEIYEKIDKYEGLTCGLIKDIIKIKKRSNALIIKANVKEKYWKASGTFKINKISLEEKEYKKKIIIKNDFQNYDEIYKLLLKKVDNTLFF